MRRTPSFRRRLAAGFLAASLIPLLACSAMMLQIFRLRMASEAEREMTEYLDTASRASRETPLSPAPWPEEGRRIPG